MFSYYNNNSLMLFLFRVCGSSRKLNPFSRARYAVYANVITAIRDDVYLDNIGEIITRND